MMMKEKVKKNRMRNKNKKTIKINVLISHSGS